MDFSSLIVLRAKVTISRNKLFYLPNDKYIVKVAERGLDQRHDDTIPPNTKGFKKGCSQCLYPLPHLVPAD